LLAHAGSCAWQIEARMHSDKGSTVVMTIAALLILVLGGLLIIIQEPVAVGR